MSIPVTCPQCHTAFEVTDDWAGKRGKCKTCGMVVQVPAGPSPARPTPQPRPQVAVGRVAPAMPAASPAPSRRSPAPAAAPAQLQAEILAAFQGEIPTFRPPLAYRLGILWVSVVMVLLPLIYIGLIGLVCYGVYYHLVYDTGMLRVARGRAAVWVFLAYLAPAAIGGISIVFMIKPLFARPAREGRTRSVTRDGEPLLFAFVDRICTAVRAPRPKRIDIDCQVNAAAAFRHGIWSLLLGSDLILKIGMPLIAGLSMGPCQNNLCHLPCFAMISPTLERSYLPCARRHNGGRDCCGEVR